MQIRLTNLTKFSSTQITYFDLHEEFGLACLIENAGEVTLNLDGAASRSWLKSAYPNIWQIKWFACNKVILHSVDHSAAIVSTMNWNHMKLGWLWWLLLSRNFIFVTYTEEALYGSRQGELENNVLSVFSRNGEFEFGLHEFLESDRDGDDLDEIQAGYTFGDNLVFIGYSSKLIRILDTAARTYRKIPVTFSLVCAHVMSGDDTRAYAIFDNRRVMQDHPERVPFELAVFDLIAETAIKQDFAPIEKELIASGFKMEALKFQPSSTGKIIVSDGEKAAFLEFSDDV